MTTTSYGFTGSLNAATWAAGEGYRGARVKSSGDLAVTAVGGTRAVTVGTGEAFASGIRSVVSAAETVNLPTPSQGQWFLITAHRDWATNLTTFAALAGSTTSTATPTSAPTAAPSNYASSPGASEDQPLAWAWVNFSSTTVTLFDVRVFVSDGIPVTGTLGGLYLLKGQLGQLAATLDSGGQVFQRTGSNTWTGLDSKYGTAAAVASAQSTANTAQSTASSAQSTANSAQTAASAAQSTANSASSSASSAQATANSAQTTANSAQTTANGAVSIASANGSVVSGWQLNRFSLKKINHIVHLDMSITRTGGAITAGGTGNITNVQIGTVPWPSITQYAGLAPGPGGPVTSSYVTSTGEVWLAAVAPQYVISTGSEITAGGSWITNS